MLLTIRVEKLSKFISYILRHNPKEENLDFDEFGWLNLNQFFETLNNHNFSINLSELIELNESFDKIRWEIDLKNEKIKASHGHSFPVILTKSLEIPPKILYHGTSSKSLENIMNNGILSMRREYVHLSETLNVAIDVGKRYGTEIILEIDTEKMLIDGIEFFKTQNNIWLTKFVDKKYLMLQPWSPENDSQNYLINQFRREISNKPKHLLYDKIENLQVIWKCFMNDDILVEDKLTNEFYVVHLTYSNDNNEKFPRFESFETFEIWAKNKLNKDQQEYYS